MKTPQSVLPILLLITLMACSSNKDITQVEKVDPEICTTQMPALNGTYTGGCKNGLAHGYGKAVGSNVTYTGEFDDGLPDGKGTMITQINGGQKTKKGYWSNGEYDAKKRLAPYKITAKKFTRHVIIKRVKVDDDQIKITVKTSPTVLKGTTISNIEIYGNSGVKNNTRGYRGFQKVKFPFKGRVDFYYQVGGDSRQAKNGHVEFTINKPGKWLVQIKAA